MAVEVQVRGAAELRRTAARLRAEGRKDLSREMSRGLSRATDRVRTAIAASAAETMPHGGGYAGVFTASLRHRLSQRGSGNTASVSLITFADGQSERRDIRALEDGRLRHPVYGRSRPGAHRGQRHANPWAVTSIRAGFHRRGTDGALNEAAHEMLQVVDDLNHRLAG